MKSIGYLKKYSMERKLLEQNYWNDIASKDDYRIHICDSWISDQDCFDMISQEFSNPKRMLEIGCGIGRLTLPMAMKFPTAKIVGVDISDKMLLRFKALHGKPRNIKLVCNDGRSLPKLFKPYDAVYSMLTFQHIDKEGIREYIKEISSVMDKGGIFRFQFVQGEENSAFSQQYYRGEILMMLMSNGFKVKDIQINLIHEQWVWITAIKI